MAWNEPGGNNRDPWSGGGGGKNQGPPDLDEVFRKFKERLDRMFGNRGSGNRGDDRSGGSGGGFGAGGLAGIAGVALVVWLASGIYIVEEGWRGVVTRFGDYVATTEPGPHWHLPYPIESVEEVNVAERRRITIGYEAISPSRTRPVLSEALMLTADENIVNVQLAVQYEVSDAAQYLFTFSNPDQTLKDVAESALREVVGRNNLDYVLTEGREEIQRQTREIIQRVLDSYEIGLEVVQVAIQDVQPPEQVQPAFLDAIKAREDKQRAINEAQGYRNEVIPLAQGEAARILEEAQAYRATAIARAEGDVSRFVQLLEEYRQAPEITRERLYLATMEEVLGGTPKVLLDVEGGDNPLLYLPVDQLMREGRERRAGGDSGDGGSADAQSMDIQAESGSVFTERRNRLRIREER
jgi:membrane protease subunit HflK